MSGRNRQGDWGELFGPRAPASQVTGCGQRRGTAQKQPSGARNGYPQDYQDPSVRPGYQPRIRAGPGPRPTDASRHAHNGGRRSRFVAVVVLVVGSRHRDHRWHSRVPRAALGIGPYGLDQPPAVPAEHGHHSDAMSGPAAGADVGPGDRAVIAGELGRTPRDLTGVAVRCPFGYPAVTESAPVLSEGSPNPTLLYVTCPSLDAVISRAEAAGGVRDLRRSCEQDPELRRCWTRSPACTAKRRGILHRECKTACSRRPPAGSRHRRSRGPRARVVSARVRGRHAGGDVRMAGARRSPRPCDAAREAWARFLPPVEEAWCTDRRCAKWQIGEKKAVIDVGTISVRLLVAEVVEGRPWPLVRKAEVTRLGQGLVPGGPLDPAARERTADAVARFAGEARAQGVDRVAAGRHQRHQRGERRRGVHPRPRAASTI